MWCVETFIYSRYVDGSNLPLPGDKILHALYVFNSYNQYKKITSEKEEERSSTFLNMPVVRDQNNNVKTKWCRKPNCSRRFISYFSQHPNRMTINWEMPTVFQRMNWKFYEWTQHSSSKSCWYLQEDITYEVTIICMAYVVCVM